MVITGGCQCVATVICCYGYDRWFTWTSWSHSLMSVVGVAMVITDGCQCVAVVMCCYGYGR